MLKVHHIQTAYGRSRILFDVSLSVGHGQVVSLLGRNGMGKTTTLKSIMGLTSVQHGEIHFDGHSLLSLSSHEISRLGIAYVPEGRRIFSRLSVRENLLATSRGNHAADAWTLERTLDFFPALTPRLHHAGTTLSGGEQQMLAIGRALMLNPRLLILDEATEGLAPMVRSQIWERLDLLKQSGLSILIVDKHIERLKLLADHHYILQKGRIVWQGDSQQLQKDQAHTEKYIGLQNTPPSA